MVTLLGQLVEVRARRESEKRVPKKLHAGTDEPTVLAVIASNLKNFP